MRDALIGFAVLTSFAWTGCTIAPTPPPRTVARTQASSEAERAAREAETEARIAAMRAAADAEMKELVGPSREEIEATDCGPRPEAPSEDWVTRCVRDTLRDPDSMKNFRFYPPTKMWDSVAKRVRWTLLYSVNAKNGYGGYAGDKVGAMYQTKDGVWLVAELCRFERDE